MKHVKLLEKIEALEKHVDSLEKKAAAGTATQVIEVAPLEIKNLEAFHQLYRATLFAPRLSGSR